MEFAVQTYFWLLTFASLTRNVVPGPKCAN